MENYILRSEYEEHNRRMEDEHKRQNHRIERLEADSEKQDKLLVSIEKMALNMEIMQTEQIEQGKRLEKLEGRDGEKWRSVTAYILTTVLGLLLGFVATHYFGM